MDNTCLRAGRPGDVGESWDELAITYNNAPANQNLSGTGGVPAMLNFSTATATFVGSFDFDVFALEGTVYSLSSPALLAAVNGDTDNNLTLMLRTSIVSGGGQHLASKEHVTHQGARLVLGEESGRMWANDASGDWNSKYQLAQVVRPRMRTSMAPFSVPRSPRRRRSLPIQRLLLNQSSLAYWTTAGPPNLTQLPVRAASIWTATRAPPASTCLTARTSSRRWSICSARQT